MGKRAIPRLRHTNTCGTPPPLFPRKRDLAQLRYVWHLWRAAAANQGWCVAAEQLAALTANTHLLAHAWQAWRRAAGTARK